MRKPHQDVLIELLAEIDAACKAHNIPYVCVDRLAWQAYKFHEFRDSTFDAYIAIPFDCADKLQGALSASNRTFDKYSHRGSTILRYVDKGSFYYNLKEKRRLTKPGIAVDIKLLKLAGDGTYRYQYGKKKLDFSKDAFFPAERFDFEGLSLPIPRDYDKFFSGIAGTNWRNETYKGIIRKDSLETMCDTSLPYEQALELPAIREAMRLKRFKFRPLFNIVQIKRGPIEKKANRFRKSRVISARRFYHWEQLYPNRERIISLMAGDDEGAFEELDALLAGYVADVAEFSKKCGLGLYVDTVIHEAAKPIIIAKYGESFYEKYDKSIPEGHRVDIDIYLRENGIDHPLLRADLS